VTEPVGATEPVVDSDGGSAPTIGRVGPGGLMAADSAFGVALVSLWHAVAQAGGVVGFAGSAGRGDVARRAAPLVEELRTGRALGVAADRGRRLVGAALLRPGSGSRAHTGRIELLAVEPALTGCGLGRGLLEALLARAGERSLDRLTVEFAEDERVQRFFERGGFAVWGRRPGWHRIDGARSDAPAGSVRDEIVMGWFR
jgi:GNAT superfamily N-acetyltransferase